MLLKMKRDEYVRQVRKECHQQYKQMMKKYNQLLQPPKLYQRKCKNYCSLLVFVLFVLSFVGLGLYYLTISSTIFNQNYSNILVLNYPLMSIKLILEKLYPVVLGMFCLSLFLPVICMVLIWIMPQYIIYFGIISTMVILGAIIGISASAKAWIPMGLSIGAIIFFSFLVITNFRHIPIGTLFIQTANQFIQKCKIVIIIPLYSLITLILFLCFWFITLICMQYSTMPNLYSKQKYQKLIAFYILWIFMLIFFFLFMYYMKIFLISDIFSYWYYSNKEPKFNHFWQAICKFNHANIGSVTHAALTTPFILIFSYLGPYDLEKEQIQNDKRCCRSIILYYLAFYRFLMEIINKYAVIVMALTGQHHTQSAKFAFSILMQKYPLMFIANSISMIIKISGIVFSAGIPTLIGYALVQNLYKDYSETYDKTMFLLLVFFICSMLSAYFVCLFSTSLCVICFYLCFHFKNQSQNIVLPCTNPKFLMLVQNNKINYIRNKLHSIYSCTGLIKISMKQETGQHK